MPRHLVGVSDCSHDACTQCGGEQGAFDEAGLRDSSRHRHTCHTLHDVCLFNGTIVPTRENSSSSFSVQQLRKLMVRSPTYSHHVFPLRDMYPLEPSRPHSAEAQLLAREMEERGLSRRALPPPNRRRQLMMNSS